MSHFLHRVCIDCAWELHVSSTAIVLVHLVIFCNDYITTCIADFCTAISVHSDSLQIAFSMSYLTCQRLIR